MLYVKLHATLHSFIAFTKMMADFQNYFNVGLGSTFSTQPNHISRHTSLFYDVKYSCYRSLGPKI